MIIKNKFALSCFVIALGVQSSAFAFNSEEHKLIGDTGASRVTIPALVQLPAGQVALKAIDRSSYLTFLQDAKELAVGFRTNDQTQYDSSKGKVQDNCYYWTYGQLAVNKNIRIPDLADIPGVNLTVQANVGATATEFTLGELVAFYGDYRRTVSCDVNANCSLTPANIDTIYFNKGNVSNTAFYCPAPIASSTYLRYIASGVVPPLGSLGNGISNTTTDTDYTEAGWWGDEVMRLVNANDWHFSTVSNSYYVGLHRIALYYVQKAITEPKYWNVALHYEANALHSLTDFFAFGHEVTNRDITSYGILTDNNLLATQAIQWQNSANAMGGAQRQADNSITLSSTLPAITPPVEVRNDFLRSYQGTNPLTFWGNYSRIEHDYHDKFNGQGAIVRNLNGDRFRVYGDAKLHLLTAADREPIYNAVTASIQSLFDAQVALRNGNTLAQIAAPGSSLFKALNYIPVYVESDADNYFWGSWVRSAQSIDEIAGAGLVSTSWSNCRIPYLWGGGSSPTARTSSCTNFSPNRTLPFRAASRWLNSGGASTTAAGNQYYKFSIGQTTSLDIKLSAESVNSYVYLIDFLGGYIASNNGGGVNSRMVLFNVPAGNYAVVAATSDVGRSDAFTVSVAKAVTSTLSKPSATVARVSLRDGNGNPVPNRDVAFFVAGNVSLNPVRVKTNVNGVADTTVSGNPGTSGTVTAQYDRLGIAPTDMVAVSGSVNFAFAVGG